MNGNYDLRHEAWIPFRRRSGTIEWGAPSVLTDRIDDDPIVALATPRPDFNGALSEFLIGLLTVAIAAEDEGDWRRWWHEPPTPEELASKLDALPAAFDLDGSGPRFMQDLQVDDFGDAREIPIERLLIDAPGEQSIERNTDLFVKRNRADAFGPPAAAMALITLQTYSPAGGKGHRTSLRGGGPLTTLAIPKSDGSSDGSDAFSPLWRTLWANAETREQWEARTPDIRAWTPQDLFPWCGQPRTSDARGRGETTPNDVHPLQCYFGVPRRIRVSFGDQGVCDLTGSTYAHVATSFQMLSYGAQYSAWRHPLSPYYQPKKGDEMLPVHGQPGGIAWKDWLGITLESPTEARKPSSSVSHFSSRRAEHIGKESFRIHAFGYDMDNMKARAWTESLIPAFAIADVGRAALVADTARRLTEGTSLVATSLKGAVEQALFQRPEDVSGDRSAVREALWDATASRFYGVMRRAVLPNATSEGMDADCRDFRGGLETTAFALFDRMAAAGETTPSTIRRVVAARFSLAMTLRGYGKLGSKMYEAMRIPVPDSARSATKDKKSAVKRPRRKEKG